MRLSIEWHKNRLSHGEDDPHYGKDYEGTHAVLKVEKDNMSFTLQTSAFNYSEVVPEVLQEIINQVNS